MRRIFEFPVNRGRNDQVELCTVEAVTNVIRHSYGHDATKDVFGVITFDADRLDVEIRDRGITMQQIDRDRLSCGSDVLRFDEYDVAALPEGGMGLQIIHEWMDEASYSSSGNENCLRMTKYLQGASKKEGAYEA